MFKSPVVYSIFQVSEISNPRFLPSLQVDIPRRWLKTFCAPALGDDIDERGVYAMEMADTLEEGGAIERIPMLRPGRMGAFVDALRYVEKRRHGSPPCVLLVL
jgi:hypothetical protein